MTTKEASTQLLDQTTRELKKKFEESAIFRDKLMEYTFFYGKKFISFLPADENFTIKFQERIEEVVKSQYYQGYYLMLEVIEDSETKIDETFLRQEDGLIRNEVPRIMKEALSTDFQNIIKTSLSHKFTMWMIQHTENVFDLISQSLFDLTCLGAYEALLDYKKRSVLLDDVDIVNCHLGSPTDLVYLNPQIYMTLLTKTSEVEIWDLYEWSSINSENTVGSVSFLSLSLDPKRYFLEFKISNRIIQFEQDNLIKTCVNMIQKNGIDTSLLNLRTYSYSDFKDLYIPKKTE
jgi:hypothetical protein